MKNIILIPVLLISSAYAQDQQIHKPLIPAVRMDVYGSLIPIPGLVTHHLHIGFGLKKLRHLGLSYSNWGGSTAHESHYWSGLGLQIRPFGGQAPFKVEAGMLHVFHRIDDDATIAKQPGAFIPYFRLHGGARLGRVFTIGATMNIIPETNKLYFTELHYNPDLTIDDLPPSLRRNWGLSLFLGFSID